jgi:hypothetical protein
MEKELFLKGLKTLLTSWGSEPPPEAIWAANDFIDFYELYTGHNHSGYFNEEDNDFNGELLEEIESW